MKYTGPTQHAGKWKTNTSWKNIRNVFIYFSSYFFVYLHCACAPTYVHEYSHSDIAKFATFPLEFSLESNPNYLFGYMQILSHCNDAVGEPFVRWRCEMPGAHVFVLSPSRLNSCSRPSSVCVCLYWLQNQLKHGWILSSTTPRWHKALESLVYLNDGGWGSVVVKALPYKSVGPGIDSKRWNLFCGSWHFRVPWGRLSL